LQNPRGSQNPTGGRTPNSSSKAIFREELRAIFAGADIKADTINKKSLLKLIEFLLQIILQIKISLAYQQQSKQTRRQA
jgi:hypothetical protein